MYPRHDAGARSGDRPAPPLSPPPLDASDWDGRLLQWSQAHLLQSHGWGTVQAGAGWRVHRLLVGVAGADRPLPLTVLEARRPAGLARLGLAGLYVPKGPACAAVDEDAWAAVLGALEELAQRTGASAVTVEPPGWAGDDAAVMRSRLEGRGWTAVATVQPAHTAVVDLTGGYEAVLARMRPKGRYNVRLAARREVEVEVPADRQAAAAVLAELCAATAVRQGIHQPDAAFLARVLAAVPSAAVHVARVRGEPVAGALVATFAGEAIYLYGGSSGRHRERQPSALLHAAIMEAAVAVGCRTYDLWGLAPEGDTGHPWYGLRQFKLSLGGVERSALGAWRRVRRPVAARAGDLVEELHRRARQGARRRSRLERGRDGGRTETPASSGG